MVRVSSVVYLPSLAHLTFAEIGTWVCRCGYCRFGTLHVRR
jgi:hypothetical protein